MRNKKGFTLIELLAVIMILAFIMAITVPSIKRAIDASEDKLYDATINQIVKGAKQYAMEYGEEIPNLLTYGEGYLSVADIINKGILEPDVENPKTGDPFTGNEGIKITKLPSGNFECVFTPTGLFAEVFVVAGGGGGASGGGGGGGVIYEPAFVLNNSTYTVTVGSGGTGGLANGGSGRSNGGNSVFGTLTAIGGGAGGQNDNLTAANAGGSGGGGGSTSTTNTNGGNGTAGQGYAGGTVSATKASPYPAAGGGGAGGVGLAPKGVATSGDGGIGLSFSISGTLKYYAGGGGGSTWSNGDHGLGGLGGGGNGGYPNGIAGTANTGGGGGGGAGSAGGSGGAGGSGIVIIKYKGVQKATGGTITSSGGYTIHTFTTSGTVSLVVSGA